MLESPDLPQLGEEVRDVANVANEVVRGDLAACALAAGALAAGALTAGTLITGPIVSGSLITGALTTGPLAAGTLSTGTLLVGALIAGDLIVGARITGTLPTGSMTRSVFSTISSDLIFLICAVDSLERITLGGAIRKYRILLKELILNNFRNIILIILRSSTNTISKQICDIKTTTLAN
jgi:hypothetical protein